MRRAMMARHNMQFAIKCSGRYIVAPLTGEPPALVIWPKDALPPTRS